MILNHSPSEDEIRRANRSLFNNKHLMDYDTPSADEAAAAAAGGAAAHPGDAVPAGGGAGGGNGRGSGVSTGNQQRMVHYRFRADVNSQEQKSHRTGLHYVAEADFRSSKISTEIAEVLLTNQIRLVEKDYAGMNAMHRACITNQVTVVDQRMSYVTLSGECR